MQTVELIFYIISAAFYAAVIGYIMRGWRK